MKSPHNDRSSCTFSFTERILKLEIVVIKKQNESYDITKPVRTYLGFSSFLIPARFVTTILFSKIIKLGSEIFAGFLPRKFKRKTVKSKFEMLIEFSTKIG